MNAPKAFSFTNEWKNEAISFPLRQNEEMITAVILHSDVLEIFDIISHE